MQVVRASLQIYVLIRHFEINTNWLVLTSFTIVHIQKWPAHGGHIPLRLYSLFSIDSQVNRPFDGLIATAETEPRSRRGRRLTAVNYISYPETRMRHSNTRRQSQQLVTSNRRRRESILGWRWQCVAHRDSHAAFRLRISRTGHRWPGTNKFIIYIYIYTFLNWK